MSVTADVDMRLDGFCSCGLAMPNLICPNCDTVQPQEIRCPDCDKPGKCESDPGKRVATNRDYAFLKVWRIRILRLYPGMQ